MNSKSNRGTTDRVGEEPPPAAESGGWRKMAHVSGFLAEWKKSGA
jgi:hypothetical protein